MIPDRDPDEIWTTLYCEGHVALYRGVHFVGWIREYKHLDPPEWRMEIGGTVFRGKEPADVVRAWERQRL